MKKLITTETLGCYCLVQNVVRKTQNSSSLTAQTDVYSVYVASRLPVFILSTTILS